MAYLSDRRVFPRQDALCHHQCYIYVYMCVHIYNKYKARDTERARERERYTYVKMEEMVADVASTEVLSMNDRTPLHQSLYVQLDGAQKY